MKTRCKMECTSVKESSDKQFDYTFSPVIGESEENKKFFKYTPGGNLNLFCTNGHDFEVGKEYYIDISLAE